MSPELKNALALTRKLFRERDHADDWGRNLIEGSAGIESMEDWTKYYSFLSNPEGFDPEAVLVPMGDGPPIPPHPEEFDVIETKNGTETIIEYKRKVQDEKSDE